MKVAIKSILNDVVDEFNDACGKGQLELAKVIFTDRVKESGIKVEDKFKMLKDISLIGTLTKLQFYFYNALLKYEGCGIIKETK